MTPRLRDRVAFLKYWDMLQMVHVCKTFTEGIITRILRREVGYFNVVTLPRPCHLAAVLGTSGWVTNVTVGRVPSNNGAQYTLRSSGPSLAHIINGVTHAISSDVPINCKYFIC